MSNERLVLKAEKGRIPLKDIAGFSETAKTYGLTGNDHAKFVVEDGVLRISIELPSRTKVAGKRAIKVKPRNKHQQAVDAQIAQHRAKKSKGEETPYVPPVGRSKKAGPVTKRECSVCGIRKNVVTVGGVKTIKPHVVKGEPCSGSGEQIGTRAKEKK